jgi:hypothetical protein
VNRILRLPVEPLIYPLWLKRENCWAADRRLAEYHKLRKYQRGNFNVWPAGASALLGQIIPSITNVTLNFSDATAANNVGCIFNDVLQGVGAINNMVKRHKLTYTAMGNDDTPTDHTGEWTPSAGGVVGSEWEVACTSLSMGVWSTEPAAVGVFTTLATADILWNVNRPGGKGRTPGTTQVIGAMEFREVADTGNNTTFTLDVTNIQT